MGRHLSLLLPVPVAVYEQVSQGVMIVIAHILLTELHIARLAPDYQVKAQRLFPRCQH